MYKAYTQSSKLVQSLASAVIQSFAHGPHYGTANLALLANRSRELSQATGIGGLSMLVEGAVKARMTKSSNGFTYATKTTEVLL